MPLAIVFSIVAVLEALPLPVLLLWPQEQNSLLPPFPLLLPLDHSLLLRDHSLLLPNYSLHPHRDQIRHSRLRYLTLHPQDRTRSHFQEPPPPQMFLVIKNKYKQVWDKIKIIA